MTDPYTLTGTTAPTATAPHDVAPTAPGAARSTGLRTALWLALLAAVVGNLVTSVAGLPAVSIPLGLVVLGLGTALVMEHRRTRA